MHDSFFLMSLLLAYLYYNYLPLDGLLVEMAVFYAVCMIVGKIFDSTSYIVVV